MSDGICSVYPNPTVDDDCPQPPPTTEPLFEAHVKDSFPPAPTGGELPATGTGAIILLAAIAVAFIATGRLMFYRVKLRQAKREALDVR